MTDAPLASEPTVSVPAPAGSDTVSIADAARSLAEFRWKRNQPESETPPAEIPEPVTTTPEDPPNTAPEAEASPPEADTGQEAPDQAEEATLPPIDPPRSWSKEQKDRWSSLPRETQEYLSQREQERDRGLSQAQQKAAEERKAIAAEREAAERARVQYEQQLPLLMQALQEANAQHFGDVRSVQDVERLAAQDPFRYIQWQAHQQKLAAAKAELDAASARQAQERQTSWQQHVQSETEKFNESLSDTDKTKIKEWSEAAPKFLQDRGFSQAELANLAQGADKLSIYDHRVQALLLDALKYRDVQNAKAKVVAKPLPPATRPGAQAPSPSSNAARIADLTKQLNNASGMQAIRLAAQITQLKRRG